jgi:hypothetical protein
VVVGNGFHQFYAAHFGHVDVEQNDVDIGMVDKEAKAFFSAFQRSFEFEKFDSADVVFQDKTGSIVVFYDNAGIGKSSFLTHG